MAGLTKPVYARKTGSRVLWRLGEGAVGNQGLYYAYADAVADAIAYVVLQ